MHPLSLVDSRSDRRVAGSNSHPASEYTGFRLDSELEKWHGQVARPSDGRCQPDRLARIIHCYTATG